MTGPFLWGCVSYLTASLQLPNYKKKSAAHKNGFEVLVKARNLDPRSRIYYAFMDCSLFVQMLITFSGLKINNFLNLSSFNLKSGHDLAGYWVDPGLCRDNKCLCESGIVQIKYEISVLLSCRARFVPSLPPPLPPG